MIKKIASLGLSLLITVSVFAQLPPGAAGNIPGGLDPSGVKRSDLPPGVDPGKIDPSEVPAEYRDKLAELKGEGTKEGNSSEGIEGNTQEVEEGTAEETLSDKREGSDTKGIDEDAYPIARVYGKNIFRTSNIKFYEKATDIIAPDSYVIGVGDKISVQVWGFSDYNGVFTVNERGYISPKLVGRVYLKGLTFAQAKSLMRKKFGQILNLSNSEMDITLTYSRVNTVNIVGEVFKPGSYKIPAINTAFNALVAAKGPNAIGSVREIYVKRGGKIVDKLDVYEFLMNPNSNKEVYLQNGDYLFVPVAKKVVKISGQVKREYAYELKENENLIALLKYAGGLKKSAYKRTIKIKRFEGTSQILVDINLQDILDNKEDFVLQDNDEIIIPEIPAVIINTVKITGSVKVPGEYELDTLLRISDLITKAEGLIFDAYMDRAYLYRLNPDLTRAIYPLNLTSIVNNKGVKENVYMQPYDELHILSRSSFADKFPVFVVGAVRNPQKLIFGKGMTLRDALMFTGGLLPRAANNRIEVSRVLTNSSNTVEPIRTVVKSFSISNDLFIDKSAESFLLEPRDQIRVRSNPDYELQQNVQIYGEVVYPGEYTLLNKDERLADLIDRTGGLEAYAFAEGATLERRRTGTIYINLKKALANRNSKYNIVLKVGDIIKIPKTMDLVYISGKLGNMDGSSISGPYVKSKRAGYYVRNYAGGFHKNALRKNTLVKRPNGKQRTTTNFLFFNLHPRVKPGCGVFVREKPKKEKKSNDSKVDWNRAIENITIKLTGLATLWLIFSQATK